STRRCSSNVQDATSVEWALMVIAERPGVAATSRKCLRKAASSMARSASKGSSTAGMTPWGIYDVWRGIADLAGWAFTLAAGSRPRQASARDHAPEPDDSIHRNPRIAEIEEWTCLLGLGRRYKVDQPSNPGSRCVHAAGAS